MLHLTDHASVEADLLDEFERLGWIWVIRTPLAAEILGDRTLAQRHAVHELNQHQGESRTIHFASLHGGLICWYPAVWLSTDVIPTIVRVV
ncbi:MAG TPA: hypothetical protein VMV69_09330 [Pirellulales bacterium]|nr:hypothetical protein [Pirellulales bacterium]